MSRQRPLRRALLGALIGLARATDGHPPTQSTHRAMLEALLLTDHGGTEELLENRLAALREEKAALVPGCQTCASPCGRTAEDDLGWLTAGEPAVVAIKGGILSALRGMAPAAYAALQREEAEEAWLSLFYDGLFALGEDWDKELLWAVAEKIGSYAAGRI